MRNVVFINASPKINESSASKYFIDALAGHIDEAAANRFFIDVRQSITRHQTLEDFRTIAKADAIVIAFPLYIFCLPGILMRFLEDYYQFHAENRVESKARVYAIVNCGFPEPGINLEAVRVIRSFSNHINARFRFGVLIGAGGMLRETKNAPFMKKPLKTLHQALSSIAGDIESNDLKDMDNINISMNIPRRFYFFMGDRGWYSSARKNGLKKKDLLRRPYQ